MGNAGFFYCCPVNHHLAQAVGDASFETFLTLLEYKCRWYGVNLIKIDRFAPSSKTCSQCGYIYKGLKLSERSWTCPECGTHHDRDFNAACNIKEFGLKALPTERGKSGLWTVQRWMTDLVS